MDFRFKAVPLFLLLLVILNGRVKAEGETESLPRLRSAPVRNLEDSVIDGTGIEDTFRLDNTAGREPGKDVASGRVSVSTVALFTLAMAAATGLGAVPFFFVELDPQWEGICNGMAAGVMVAASFDLIQEGHEHGGSNWVVIGILAGGVFIWLCKKVVYPKSFTFSLLLLYNFVYFFNVRILWVVPYLYHILVQFLNLPFVSVEVIFLP